MNSQYFLSPRLTATLFSCVAHILALGFAAGVELTAARKPVTIVKVELRFQQAVPLPVGDAAHAGANPAPPAPTPIPRPEVKPVPKPLKPKPVLPPQQVVAPKPKPRPKPPPQPEVIAATTPTESAPIALPLDSASSESTAAGGAQSQADGNNQRGMGGAGGQTGTGSEGRSSQGSGKGSSAQPDYGVNPKPPYPMLARRMGVQGTVVLRVHVHADGSVIAAEVKQSSGSALLDDSALRTVRDSWQFVPARLNDEAVESWVEVPIRFVLGTS